MTVRNWDYNLPHKVLDKLIFHIILLFLPLPLYIQYLIWFFRLNDLAEHIPWTNYSNTELEDEEERFLLTKRREEGGHLKVWKMVYFQINRYYQGCDKNLSCVANRSSLIKTHAKCLHCKYTLNKAFPKRFWKGLKN